jgi:hypothetical protein
MGWWICTELIGSRLFGNFCSVSLSRFAPPDDHFAQIAEVVGVCNKFRNAAN